MINFSMVWGPVSLLQMIVPKMGNHETHHTEDFAAGLLLWPRESEDAKPGPTNQTLISNQKTRPHPHHLSTDQSFSSTHLSSPTGEVMPPIPPTQSPLATCQLNDPKEKAIHKHQWYIHAPLTQWSTSNPPIFYGPMMVGFFFSFSFLPILWVLLILSCQERSGIKPYAFK